MISCSDNNKINQNFHINGKFTHALANCDNTENTEINCFEIINFFDKSRASVLTAGNDIVFVTNYKIIGNKIQIGKTEGLKFNISFIINNEKNLIRIENNDVWVKSE